MNKQTNKSKIKTIIILVLALAIFCVASKEEEKSDIQNQQDLEEFVLEQV